jgi:hypothetical protein
MSTVTGPTSSTDNAITRWDGTSGAVVQDSTVLIDDTGNLTEVTSISIGSGTIGGYGCVIDGSGNINSATYVNAPTGTFVDVDASGTISGVRIKSDNGTIDTDQSTGTLSAYRLLAVNSSESGYNVAFIAGSPALTGTYTVVMTVPNATTNLTISADADISGTNTGDQTIALTGDVTGSGTGSFATTIKSSIALAGSPTTTTQSAGDNSTKIATTAYVDAAVSVGGIVLTGYLSGCLVTNNATTPNTKVDIASGIAVNSTSTVYIKSAGYTVDFSSSGAVNKLDTGTIAASTWYHVFVIAKADGTTGGLASLSATAPTLPSGYTVFRRVGSVLTDSSAHILGFKAAYTGGGTTEMFWNASVLDINTTTLGTASTAFTLSVPTGIICEANLQYFLWTVNIIMMRSLDQPNEAPTGTAAPTATFGSSAAGANYGAGHIRLRTSTASQIALRSDTANTKILVSTLGWVDYRGT